ncbi:DDE superfamily endonuclease [Hirsutella rhossiliensis]|uniref:DDE superfamily endonuclease domain-containing protein n=1 Tax=Hirsutella rhossiliensis TaxID=111463 RepID=A0A9P8MQH2_9HYPO|nr:DDE superfamily endonuclease domain-containing protein [Hirsutella rhossiliensis]KAH0959304.1 DDE superfamily endonuclease domain-containing protein [Hirsutella rhossiliensis]
MVTITTSPKGYVNDILALEFIDHFERHTRPQVPEEERLVLMDGCENHFTYELLFPLPPHVTHLLQPLDVGVFGPYKHWHQQVLYREIANGATNFNKTDFLFHLQEMRNRTFKRPTILSAWEKSGLFPFNPSVVLDQLQDALSSLTDSVRERELLGSLRKARQ